MIVGGRAIAGCGGAAVAVMAGATSSGAVLAALGDGLSRSSECTKSTPAIIAVTASSAIEAAATNDAVILKGAGGASAAPRLDVPGPVAGLHGLAAEDSCGWIECIEPRIDGMGAACGRIECIEPRIDGMGAASGWIECIEPRIDGMGAASGWIECIDRRIDGTGITMWRGCPDPIG